MLHLYMFKCDEFAGPETDYLDLILRLLDRLLFRQLNTIGRTISRILSSFPYAPHYYILALFLHKCTK